MPLSELRKKWSGMTFHVAAEEMRRLAEDPEKTEKLVMYGLYKQAVHGDIPPIQDFKPIEDGSEECEKYNSWKKYEGMSVDKAREEYVRIAEEMIRKYGRKIERCQWNSQVWSVDY